MTDFLMPGSRARSRNIPLPTRLTDELTLANGNLTFYVGPSGLDTNPGTQAAPFFTIQRALNVAALYDYQSNWFPTIQCLAGTYTITNQGPPELPLLVNCLVNAVLQGDTTTPGNCILYDQNQNSCLTAAPNARWIVRGFQFDSQVIAILMDNYGSYIQLNVKNEWTDRTNGGIETLVSAQFGSEFDLRGTLTVLVNNFGRFAFLIEWALMQVNGATINFQANTVVNGQFLSISNWSRYTEGGTTYNNIGTMTGTKYTAFNFCEIHTSDGTDTHLGGNVNNAGDCTSEITGPIAQGSFFSQYSGLPSTAGIAQADTWAVVKDTIAGGIYAVANLGNVITVFSGPSHVRSTADQTTTSTSLATVLSLPILTGRNYTFEAFLISTCSTTGGVQYSITSTALSTAIEWSGHTLSANTVAGQVVSTALGSLVGPLLPSTTQVATYINGTITNVASTGSLAIQFAQDVSTTTVSSVKRGSYLRLFDIN